MSIIGGYRWAGMVCDCGRPARGESTTSEHTGAVAHWCRQCSVEHCELDRYLRAQPGHPARLGHRR